MNYQHIEIDARGPVGRVWLNRPAKHNAFDEAMIAELAHVFAELGAAAAVRVVVLGGRGPSFSAGADLGWMERAAGHSEEENRRDARALAEMLRGIDRCPKPTIARVHGAALGGGAGLVAACDLAVAAEPAVFATSEARYGLIPATIGPYVVAAIGPRSARRYFLTAERFAAAEAWRIGLVHEVCPVAELDARIDGLIASLLACGPAAQAAAKELILRVAGAAIDAELIEHTAQSIAALRATPEAREGIAAFLQKRKPTWSP